MRRQYQWRTAATIISGGYPGEEVGVIGGTTDWHTTDTMSGSTTAQYYYRDSDSMNNNQSSRVVVTISESWTASISQKNYLTVTLTTTIDSIVRDNIRGNPGTQGRSIFVRRESGGTLLWSKTNDAVATAHTIMGTPLVLETYSFTLAPGQNLSRGSIYYRSNVVGHDSDPLPNIYTDVLWMGTEFKNPLPIDYRPGATLKSNSEYGNVTDGVWMTHNRTNKACHILSDVDNMTWKELRTVGYPDGQGNPPLMLRADNNSSWYNMAEIGKY